MEYHNLQILLVEDDPDHAELVSHYLELLDEPRVGTIHAGTLEEGIGIATSGRAGLVLLDLQLPDSTFWETVERMTTAAPRLPIIVLTSLSDLDLALEAMQQGAQDYLVKSELSGEVLTRAIRYALERKRAALAVEEGRDRLRRFVTSVMEGMQPPLTQARTLLAALEQEHDLDDEARALLRRADGLVSRVATAAEEIARYAPDMQREHPAEV